jgi:hypothetical protein
MREHGLMLGESGSGGRRTIQLNYWARAVRAPRQGGTVNCTLARRFREKVVDMTERPSRDLRLRQTFTESAGLLRTRAAPPQNRVAGSSPAGPAWRSILATSSCNGGPSTAVSHGTEGGLTLAERPTTIDAGSGPSAILVHHQGGEFPQTPKVWI